MEMTKLKLNDFIQITILGLVIFLLLELSRGTIFFTLLIGLLGFAGVVIIVRNFR